MGTSSQLSQDLEIERQIIDQLKTIQEEIEDERAKGIVRQIIVTKSLTLRTAPCLISKIH